MKEGKLLLAVAGIVGGIGVQYDFLGSFSLAVGMVQKPLMTHGAQPFDGLLVGMLLQPLERGLRGPRIAFTNDGLKRVIAAQSINVVAVLVACADLINSLTQHLMGVVHDEQRITPIVEKPGKFFRERQLRIELAQQQKARVAGDLTPIKIENDLRLKTKPELIMTLCSHRSSVCCERLVW